LTTYFSDGFESGNFTAWNAGPIGVIGISTASPHHGIYCTTGSRQLNTEFTGCADNLGTAYSSLYSRVYVRMGSALPATWANCGIRLGSAADSYIASTIVDCANNKWGLRILNTAATSYWETTSTMTIAADTWYCLELYVNIAAAGTGTLWVDGVQKVTGTYDNDAAGNPRIVYCRAALNANEAAPIVFGFDCCSYGDAYIGPEVSAVAVKRRLLMGVGL